MPDDKNKKKKPNLSAECNPFSINCHGRKLRPTDEHTRPTPGGGTKAVVQPEYEEKFGYKAGTAKAGEPMQEKPEESGSGMSKADRDARMKKYKTRY